MKSWRRFILAFSFFVGVLAFAGAVLWAIAGAGLYGSPVAGINNTDKMLLLLVLMCGPMAVLPSTIVEHRFSNWGGSSLATLSFVPILCVCLSAVQSLDTPAGSLSYATATVWLCVGAPNFALGSSLLLSNAEKSGVLLVVWLIELPLAVILTVYYAWYTDLWHLALRFLDRFLHWIAPFFV